MHLRQTFTMLCAAVLLAACGSGDSPPVQAEPVRTEQLNASIRAFITGFPGQCPRLLACGNIVMVDCNSAADGPQNYYDNTTGEVVMRCGGNCMLPTVSDPKVCRACPPPEWTCKTGG